MQFSTPVISGEPLHHIGYDSRTLFMGSCFATHVSAKFAYYQFRQWLNPFGILFQPTAIERVIFRALGEQPFSEADLIPAHGVISCFDAHSELNAPDVPSAIERLNAASHLLRYAVFQATHIVFSLGSAWTYTYTESGKEVANCHRIPQSQFSKWMLSAADVTRSLAGIEQQIRDVNPGVKLIFTISPVRHLKDGFTENQRSKSSLILGLHDFLASRPGQNYYFPAYEIMLDELRDYRFYQPDMLHPSPVAVDYIWERFSQIHLAPHVSGIMDQAARIRRALAHRPFSTQSGEYQKFKADVHRQIEEFKTRIPWADFQTDV